MTRKLSLLFVSALTLLTVESQAVVSFIGNYSSNLKISDGSTNAPVGTRYIVVVDTGNDGFGSALTNTIASGTTLNVGDLFGGDQIIQSSQIPTLVGRAATAVSNQPFDVAPFAGKQFALIWFDPNTLPGVDTTVADGDKYGITRDSLWVMPSVAGSFNFSTTPVGSDFRQMGGTGFLPGGTTLTIGAAPEPSRFLLLGLGLVGMIFRRRR
jgi:hypothetical protein